MEIIKSSILGAGKTDNGSKPERSVWLSESRRREPKECGGTMIKAEFKRKESAWKEFLAASNEEAKERCMEAYREEKRKVKKVYISEQKEIK